MSAEICKGQRRRVAPNPEAPEIFILRDFGNGRYDVRLPDGRVRRWLRATVIKRYPAVVQDAPAPAAVSKKERKAALDALARETQVAGGYPECRSTDAHPEITRDSLEHVTEAARDYFSRSPSPLARVREALEHMVHHPEAPIPGPARQALADLTAFAHHVLPEAMQALHDTRHRARVMRDGCKAWDTCPDCHALLGVR